MTPAPRWRPSTDLNVIAFAPRCHPEVRSPANLVDIVDQLDPAGAERYRRRDVDSNGTLDTFCNFFVRDALASLGVHVPKLRANQLCGFFVTALDWRAVTQHEAVMRACSGYPTVAGWVNPKGGPGHVALMIPSVRADVPLCAQAGARNFASGTIALAFGNLPVSYWTHE